ncbi:MAG: secondary thiamine-phosphate synthase enzyme YjbQ [Actinomycetota bacterium]
MADDRAPLEGLGPMKSWRDDVELTAPGRLSFVDVTDELRRAIKDSGITDGCAVAFCAHTTSALVINEWEEGALEDFRARLETLIPDDVSYSHDDLERRTQNLQDGHERPNGRSHVAQMLLGGSSHAIPVAGGEALLGRWQRLILVELDEPKPRRILFHVFGL